MHRPSNSSLHLLDGSFAAGGATFELGAWLPNSNSGCEPRSWSELRIWKPSALIGGQSSMLVQASSPRTLEPSKLPSSEAPKPRTRGLADTASGAIKVNRRATSQRPTDKLYVGFAALAPVCFHLGWHSFVAASLRQQACERRKLVSCSSVCVCVCAFGGSITAHCAIVSTKQSAHKSAAEPATTIRARSASAH